MKILAIRHTSVNVPSGICYGHLDVELSVHFAEEAEAVRQLLPDDVQRYMAISSPSFRCTNLASRLGLTFSTDARLMELNFGLWEGESWNNIYETDKGKEWFQDYEHTICPGGESFNQLIKRVQEVVEYYARNKTENLLIVAHGGTLRALLLICGVCQTPSETFAKEIAYGAVLHLIYPA
ncbi:MAG: histidine phosphatase family protein [Porphyromonas sp.]|nr:histidine phosphatase family protein [Porphyromonas sp.]